MDLDKKQRLYTLDGSCIILNELLTNIENGKLNSLHDLKHYIIYKVKLVDKEMTRLEEELGIGSE